MEHPAPLSLTLELDEVADPITGRLVHAGHEPVPFHGWLGLAVALARLTGNPGPQERAP